MDKPNVISTDEIDSELDAPIWSVISFERCEAAGLTYFEAAEKAAELDESGVTGLCIVTDDAGARISTS